ncbi:hypothetical protein JAO73_01760 [Hymenobacter sp. BT523]|uniref:hypothetical protein n=1 Tax=Hymenobacter sp. BT523 TaxID=2795725 RepID=UPI0018ED5DCA|nr:hypothetical protein [Hymenobacter sp. BT523]MBJ6107718.1 hypothetical protein [Hymenobacter sp. BT523]
MQQFLPDAESITEFCGPYEARGFKFEVVLSPHLGGYGLRMQFGEGSSVSPIFPLPASEMDSPEAAARWMAHLRDEQLSQFSYLLRQ